MKQKVEDLTSHVAALLRASDRESLSAIMTRGQVDAATLQPLMRAIDAAIYRELKSIADYIGFLRQEISALQPNDMRSTRIPSAGQELSAVVHATEDAGNAIMERAEAVMSADASNLAAYKTFVAEQMTAIFEACSFQDLTGQRIAKVVETLQQIEARVARFADATRANDTNGFANDTEAATAERKARLFIHGPTLAGEGNSQSKVDEIIDENPKSASQDDIDKLFV
jgi:chemotaxis protein CheZ